MAIHFVDGECSYTELPPSAIDRLNSRLNSTNQRVSEITPYMEKKTAYIGDTEVEFSKAKDGNTLATVVTESGTQIPCLLEITDKIKVLFDELQEVATVTISIQ